MLYAFSAHVVSIHVIQVIGVKNRHNKVSIFHKSSVLKLFCFWIFEAVDVFLSFCIHLRKLLLLLFAFVCVLLWYICASFLDLFWNLFVSPEFSIYFFLRLIALGDKHFPASHIIHRLIFMCEEISLNKWAIFHCNFFSLALNGTLSLQVSKRHLNFAFVFLVFAVDSSTTCSSLTCSLVGICPSRKLSWLDHNSSKKLTESVQQFSFFLRRFNLVPIFRECSF